MNCSDRVPTPVVASVVLALGLTMFALSACQQNPEGVFSPDEVYVLGTPQITEAVGIAPGEIRLTWTRIDGAAGYRLERSSNGKWDNESARAAFIPDARADSTLHQSILDDDYNLENGATMAYRVRAEVERGSSSVTSYGIQWWWMPQTSRGRSKWSNVTWCVATDQVPPIALQSPAAVDIDGSLWYLAWELPERAEREKNLQIELRYPKPRAHFMYGEISGSPMNPYGLVNQWWVVGDEDLASGDRLEDVSRIMARTVDQAGNTSEWVNFVPELRLEPRVLIQQSDQLYPNHYWGYETEVIALRQRSGRVLVHAGSGVHDFTTAPASFLCALPGRRSDPVPMRKGGWSTDEWAFAMIGPHEVPDSLCVRIVLSAPEDESCEPEDVHLPYPGPTHPKYEMVPSGDCLAIAAGSTGRTDSLDVIVYYEGRYPDGPGQHRHRGSLEELRTSIFPEFEFVRVEKAFADTRDGIRVVLSLWNQQGGVDSAYIRLVGDEWRTPYLIGARIDDACWTNSGELALYFGSRHEWDGPGIYSRAGILVPQDKGAGKLTRATYSRTRVSNDASGLPRFRTFVWGSFLNGEWSMLSMDNRLYGFERW